MYVYVGAAIHIYAYKSRPEVGHLSQFFFVLYIEAWSLVQLASLLWDLLFLPPEYMGFQVDDHDCSPFTWAGDQNLGPHICMASVLPTETSSQALISIL